MRRLTTASSLLAVLLAAAPASAQQQGTAPPAAPAAAPSFEELQATIARMQRQVESLGEAAAQRDKALDFLSEQVDKAAGQIKGAGQATESLRGQSAALTDELQGARTERDRVAAEARAREDQLGQAQRTLAALERSLAEERKGKDGLQGELERARAQVAAVTTELDGERKGRGATEAELERTRGQLAALLAYLEEERKGRGEAAASLEAERAQLAALRGDLEAERKGRGEVAAQLDAARSGLAEAGTRVASLERDLAATRERAAEERRLLQGELATLHTTIEALNARLAEAATSGVRQAGLIQDLDRQLKEALAARVEELSQYRSEFFGRLRQLLGDRPDIRIVGDRFVFQSELLFESGSAELDPEGQASLRDLARSLREVAATIPPDIDWVLRVDGHTDRLPVRAGPFASNWELSTARAISVVRFLAAQGIPPERLAAAGFGEFRPLDPREDEIAYRRNRRIEFKLTEG
jgi:chemotaxis protein MotB